MKLSLPALARVTAAAVCLGVAVSSAGAAERGTGSIVVRLLSDPAPAGVAWSYSGAGPVFQLRASGSAKTISTLADGTYRLVEAGAVSGQPKTLTSLTCADPSGGTTVETATGTATIALTSGERVTCTFSHRALGPRPAAAAVQLAAKYAPVLRLASGERYRPLRLEDYLTKTDLRNGSPPRGTLSQARPTLFSLPVTSTPTYLDIRGAQPSAGATTYPSIEQQLESARPRPNVYFHLTYQPAAGRVAIEYWFLYLYNDFYDQHEADWEGVAVVLENGTPLGATYSQHQGRKWVAWSALSTTGGHPIVYVARGSHAEYPKAGSYSIRVCWTLHGRHCSPSPRVDGATGSGPTVAPKAYDLQPFGGVGYTGSWGSGNYVLGIGLTQDRITDPRRRSEYTNPFAAVP
jgi:Vacuolar protein sorting-associated protein 62